MLMSVGFMWLCVGLICWIFYWGERLIVYLFGIEVKGFMVFYF